ncbi:Uncharacterised protein [Mycobacterium tuberculosis]|nr:Uncharacterised protein [Mycobacterium tuberculosis]
MWLRSRCISRSNASSGLESGTNTAGRITRATVVSRPPFVEQNVCSTRSFRYTTPTMSSTFSPITGIRECPLRTARVIA